MNLRLVKLHSDYRNSFLRMLEDYSMRDPDNGEFYSRGLISFEEFVDQLIEEEEGEVLPPGFVPCSHRWLLDNENEIVGIVRIRHNIEPKFLFEEVGHIGYDVPPSKRGKGYGIACLQFGLEEAKHVGVTNVLVCADDANPPSWRTIERCGGVFERSYQSDHWNCLVRRYWIDIKN